MNSWVVSSNPVTTYRARDWLEDGNAEVDWIASKNIKNGDLVYIYEVMPPRGRGGIVYRTRVTALGITAGDKIDDERYWASKIYPSYITNETKFMRLELIDSPFNEVIQYSKLKEKGFAAPQTGAYLLDKKPILLEYIEKRFGDYI